ncbi:MAG: choice-of-anchor A family protein [Phycisphaerales bacterium]|nr:choice-of-anchor A family protein [Phycisphaerales bacterium]
MNEYNQIVLGNLQTGEDTEGRAFVGGNLSGSAAQFGTHLTPDSAWLGADVPQVGGNTTLGNLHMEAGNYRRTGSRTGTVDFNGGGHEIVDPAVAGMVSGYQNQLTSLSSYLGGLASDSTIQGPTNQPAPLKFIATPDGDGIAVFNLTASQLTSNLVQQLELTTNGATSIVVNVTDASVNFNSGDFVGSRQNAAVRASTIWNFIGATGITLDRQWNGAILAPGAHLTNSTAIEGSVFVGSMTQNGEVHLPNYDGHVPTPGSIVLAGAAVVVAARRRR